MRMPSCPATLPCDVVNRTFIGKLEETIKTKGVSVLSTIKLNRTLTDWLINHIHKCDKLIGECIAAKANRAV